MSRGLGRVQEAILGGLRELDSAYPHRFATLYDITVNVFGRRALDPATRAHIESVRRALITLERGGYIELTYLNAPVGEEKNPATGLAQLAGIAPPDRDMRTWRRQLAARIRR